MMTSESIRVLMWTRKSKGSEDDIGYEEQVEKVRELARSLTGEEHIDHLDLGVRTGFSRLSEREVNNPLDQDERVQDALDRIRAGEYDLIAAFDDRRVSRDGFIHTIKLAMKDGDAQFAFKADVAEDDLTYDIQRRVERHTKEEEIRKAIDALRRRREKGYDEGRPRWGTTYDDNNAFLVPGENFEDVLRAIAMREVVDEGGNHVHSYRNILDATTIGSTGTLTSILNRRDWYLALAQEHDVGLPDVPTPANP